MSLPGRHLLAVTLVLIAIQTTPTCRGHAQAPQICGQNIGAGDVPPVIDATSGSRTVTIGGTGGPIWLQFTTDCSHGVTVDVRPPNAATILTAVKASDGKMVVAKLRPHRTDFVVVVTRAGGGTDTIRFRPQGQ